jgi:WD40 repeat protein
MTPHNSGTTERDRRLQAVLVAYLEAAEQGRTPDLRTWQARHPEFAAELAEYAANHARLEHLAAPLRQVAEAAQAEAASRRTVPPEEGSTVAPAPGTQVRYFGDYELLEEIARGGMGVVFRARQVSLNRVVALKMILRGELASEQDVQRFRTEAQAAGNLDHPHIVPVYEVGEHQGQHYFAMRLVEGGSLAARLDEMRTKPREVVRLLAAVARAVHFAHQRGIIHRDLKPANILLDGKGQPHVSDFGLAKRVEGDGGQTRTGAIVGTPAYMPPEQALGEKGLTTAADVYSLGAVLYEGLTGRPPFRGATPLETVLQVVDQEPQRPRQLSPRLDADLETVCLKCLEKEPARRYGSAEALADDLERWLGGEPISARPAGAVERSWRWCRRNPAVAGLLTAVAAALLLGATVATAFAWWALGERDRADSNAAMALQREQDALARKAEAEDARSEADDAARKAQTNEQRALKAEKEAAAEAEAARQAEREARQRGYDAKLLLAQVAWEQRQVPLFLDLLAEQQPRPGQEDLRHFEWYYWQSRFRRGQVTLRGHKDGIFSMTFSPDGTRLATASFDKTVKVWDTTTAREVLTFKGHRAGVFGVAFSPDGKYIASSAGDSYHPDRPGELKVWDATTGQEVVSCRGHTRMVVGVALSPDGKRLASSSHDQTVKVWDAQTGKELLSIPISGGPHPILHQVDCLAFSPDGKRLAGGSQDKTVTVWDALSGEETLTLAGHTGPVESVAFSPDGRRLASGAGVYGKPGEVKLWDAATGQELLTLKGHKGPVRSVSFSPDSQRLAGAGSYFNGDTRGEVKVWDTATGQQAFAIRVAADSVAFSPDGTRLAGTTGANTLKVWDAATGRELLTLKGHLGEVRCVAFSPDGKRLASSSADQTVKVWDAATGQETLTLKGHPKGVFGVCFSPDGKRLASASSEGTVKVWEADTGTPATATPAGG